LSILSTILGIAGSAGCVERSPGEPDGSPARAPDEASSRTEHDHVALSFSVPRFRQQASGHAYAPRPTAATPGAASSSAPLAITTHNFNASKQELPLWVYDVVGSRDVNHHQGTVVGRSPFGDPGTDRIPTYLVPLVIRTHAIATGFDPQTDMLTTTVAGDTTIDASAPDDRCLTAPNNVPVDVVAHSPMFAPARFEFGSADLGTTQYIDAYQRASFFGALGSQVDRYHLLFGPVNLLAPVVIDVPATAGVAIVDPDLVTTTHAGGSTSCTPMMLLDFKWFDAYMTGTVLPALARHGLTTGALPVFIAYNTFMGGLNITDLSSNNCCITGYHSATTASPGQTYAVAELDRTGFFSGPAEGFDTKTVSHELAEWALDPFGDNFAAPYGDDGACDNLVEVADPLTSKTLPAITMPNGFSYHVQELAFFSWFFGAPSIGANGWFSNDQTLLGDAGPVCQ
jgi:hypothetical protein